MYPFDDAAALRNHMGCISGFAVNYTIYGEYIDLDVQHLSKYQFDI